MIQDFVDGFLFSPDMQFVVLIRKTKPEWQAGLLNAVGGKIEPEELPLQAIEREFMEETGVVQHHWYPYLSLSLAHGRTLHCFWATSLNYDKVQSLTEEKVEVFSVEEIMRRTDIIPNLRWLIQMAISFSLGERSSYFSAQEQV